MSETTGYVYYVSPHGSDGHDGRSLETPFRTIGRAAEVMAAGDTCRIRGGVYRETVAPARSGTKVRPVRFEAFAGERVVVDGCDPVGGWSHHEGSVYKAAMDWSLREGNGNIVFLNGELASEASWPPIADRLDGSLYAVVDAAESGGALFSLFDEDLRAFPDGYWNGAIVACVSGVGYFMSTAVIRDFQGGTIYHDPWVSSDSCYYAHAGNRYWITRSLNALCGDRQWFHDSDEGQLYVRVPEGMRPEQLEAEAKRREYAFDLRGCAYIEIEGIDVRAASITTADAHHCTLSRLNVCAIDRYFGARQSLYGVTKGIAFGGSDNVIRECEISRFEGIGVSFSGKRNSLINCYVHDGNYEASYASMLWIEGENHLVSHNTITRAGRTHISGIFARSVIQYNDISHANILTQDSGIIFLFNTDYDNTEVHHNWMHDNESRTFSFGFYMDAWTSGVTAYRNVVWNIPNRGLQINNPNQRTLLYNNTFYRSGAAQMDVFAIQQMTGSHVVNNIFDSGRITKWNDEALYSHNLTDVEAGFADPEGHDFRLRPDSPAVGAGRHVPGIAGTAGGAAPDLGAYQSGEPYWVPGHDFAKRPEVSLLFASVENNSKLSNGGFERGEWGAWTPAKGSPRVVFGCAWDYSANGYAAVVRSNKYAAMLGQGERIEQKASGLLPNTAYVFWAGIKNEGAYRLAVDYDDCRAGAAWDRGEGGGYAVYRDSRYIGPLQPGDWLSYKDIDFGKYGKYNSLAIGLTKIAGPLVIEARLDSVDGPLLGTVQQTEDYYESWRYFTVPIASPHPKGMHDIVIVAKAGSCLFDNFKVYPSIMHCSGGDVRMHVLGRDGEVIASRTVCKYNWESGGDKLAFTTGPDETEVTVAIENVGHLFAVVDDCGLWKPELPELSAAGRRAAK
ncbi:MAG: right-handed parallel beta-helix repeat-containing protein [Paenibacillaceae bacterium]|nr:right-handed parallel beta-helix repeat-containing protein [Paenibacillaceae bacterium]